MPNVLTTEHVLPQTVDAASEWAQNWPDVDERARWLNRLANLVPLNRARNCKALNYDFDRKKSAYFVGSSGFAHMRLLVRSCIRMDGLRQWLRHGKTPC